MAAATAVCCVLRTSSDVLMLSRRLSLSSLASTSSYLPHKSNVILRRGEIDDISVFAFFVTEGVIPYLIGRTHEVFLNTSVSKIFNANYSFGSAIWDCRLDGTGGEYEDFTHKEFYYDTAIQRYR